MNDADYLITEQDFSGKSGCHLKPRRSCFGALSIHVGVTSHGSRCRTPAAVLRAAIIMFSVTRAQPLHFCCMAIFVWEEIKGVDDIFKRLFADATEESNQINAS